MRDLLDHASQDANQLGLTFGQALSPEQQSKLTDNIIWYVPVSVDGHTVLAPQLYLAPGKETIRSGGVIAAGNDLSLSGGSISNSGTISAGQSLNLVATQGDLDNDGGTISGKDVSLTSLAGSIHNNSLLQESQTIGGVQQNLGQQGNIIATGDARLSAAKDILFTGGNLQAGGDASLIAGGGLTLGALTAQSSENINRHHYSHQANETKNYGSSVMAGGGVTLAALGGDLTLAGSGVTAGTDALLQAKGNVALQAVTDHRYDYTRTVSKGFLSKKTITQSKDITDEIGGLIVANNNIAVSAGGDVSIAGAIDGKKNVALSSGGNLTVTALKNTEDTYYQKKKSGLIASLKGGSFSFGVGRSQNTDTNTGVTWTPSDLRAENGNLLLTSKGNTLVKGSTLSAGQNLQLNGSSVTLDDAINTLTQIQQSKSSFLGVTAGITSSSAAGKALSGKKKDPSSQGQPSISLLRTESALDVAGEQGKGLGDYMPGNVSQVLSQFGVNGNALTVQANMGFSKVKSFAQQTTHTVQGDSLNAGNTVSIIARGDNPQDGTSGAIKAVSAQINAQNIALEAQKNIKLQSDWNTLSAFSKTHSSGVSAGVSFGTSSVGPDVSVDNTRQNATKESGTAVNTSLNAQQNIALDASHGGMTLAGADLHAGQSAVLQSKGDMTLQAVTNYQSSTYNSTNHGLFTKQKDIDNNASTNETGNTIAAQNDVALSSGGNISLAGSLTGGRNVSVTAAGTVDVNALKTTAHSFKEHKTSGLTSSSENGQSKLGYGKSDDQSTVDATDWQGSLLKAAQHDLTIHSGGATTITSSSLSAGHDLGIDASSVAFKALEDTLTQQQLHKSLFIGVTAGLSPNSIAGQALQSVLGALQSSGKGSTLLR
ncbi:hemagglutinin repeat-containing protein, partial [Saccharibacter floricola]